MYYGILKTSINNVTLSYLNHGAVLMETFFFGCGDHSLDLFFSQAMDGVIDLEAFAEFTGSDQDFHFMTPGRGGVLYL